MLLQSLVHKKNENLKLPCTLTATLKSKVVPLNWWLSQYWFTETCTFKCSSALHVQLYNMAFGCYNMTNKRAMHATFQVAAVGSKC